MKILALAVLASGVVATFLATQDVTPVTVDNFTSRG